MKAKVVNELSCYLGVIIDVKLLNYKYIMGYLPGTFEKVSFPFTDVELTFDCEWEKNVIKYKDILNISLPPTTSIKFYAAICYTIEGYFKGEIKSIGILRNSDEKARKKYWYKSIDIIINDNHPVSITASGREYTDIYNINTEEVDINSFTRQCKEGIYKLKEIINKGSQKLRLYEKALSNIETSGPIKYWHKAIEGEVTPL